MAVQKSQMPSRRLSRRQPRITVIQQRGGPSWSSLLGAAGVGVGAGAAVEYLFDPDRGRARRSRIRDQQAHLAHQTTTGLETLSHDLTNRGRGLAARLRYRFTSWNVDDRVLHDRVRAELGRHVSHPHAVTVAVDNAVVTLSGDVLAAEAERALRAIAWVPGVEQVIASWAVHQDPTGVSSLQGTARPREPRPELFQEHWSPTTRLLAALGAAGIWFSTARLPAPLRRTARAAGLALGARAVTNLSLTRLTGITAGRRAIDVDDSISVDAPPERIWPVVSDYSFYPQLMPDVRQVRRTADGQRSHWVVTGPAHIPVVFDAEETEREEGRGIAWKTVEGQLVGHTGRLHLDPEDGSKTRVQVQLTYNPVAGALGHAVAALFRADPRHKLHEDLQRLKTYVETGTTAHDAAQPLR